MTKAMTPDAIKNMIRKMLVEEGYVKAERRGDLVPNCDPQFGVPCPDWRKPGGSPPGQA